MSIGIDPKFPNAIVAAIVVDETTLATYLPDRVIPLTLDRNGALLVRVNGAITASLGTTITIADAMAFTSGSLIASAVVGYNGASFDRIRSVDDNSDGVATIALGRLAVDGRPMLFNGTTWDRQRGNNNLTLLASAARTATTTSADQVNYNARGAHFYINVTAAGTSTLTVSIQVKDPISGNYITVLTSAALTGTGTTALKIYPGITGVSNSSASDTLARDFRVNCVKGDASSWTYSVSASLVI